MIREIQDTALFQREDSQLHKVMKLDTPSLQQWVRASFKSDARRSKTLAIWEAAVVDPALQCNVSSIPKDMEHIMTKFTAVIQGGQADDEYVAQLKIAAGALNGSLAAHPLVCGLALQCHRMVEKESRGVCMRGRRSSESAFEKALIADAGLTLAIHGSNYALAKSFGLAASALKIDVDDLHKHSLPNPCLAAMWPNVLEQNFALCDQRFVRQTGAPKRALTPWRKS